MKAWFLALPFAVMALAVQAQGAAPAFPKGPGQAAVQKACAGCHPPTMVTAKRYDADHWADVVDQMIGKGAPVPDADYDVIVTYLAKNYGVKK